MKTRGFVTGIKRVGGKLRRLVVKADGTTEVQETTIEMSAPISLGPKNKRELVRMLKDLPDDVLSEGEKRSIAAVMSFPAKLVRNIMTTKADTVTLNANDYLGPLMLDKLHKTGQIHFLVKAGAKVVGALHIGDLLSLKIKESDRVSSYLDQNLIYVREDYTLEMAMAAFLRTGALMGVVINDDGQWTGTLMLEDLVIYLVGHAVEDDFESDHEKDVVKTRR